MCQIGLHSIQFNKKDKEIKDLYINYRNFLPEGYLNDARGEDEEEDEEEEEEKEENKKLEALCLDNVDIKGMSSYIGHTGYIKAESLLTIMKNHGINLTRNQALELLQVSFLNFFFYFFSS